MRKEKQTCPRRMLEMGPWEREEHLDCWERRRQDKPYPSRERYLFKREPFRRCSFCGGIHPDDVVRLIKDGVVTQSTTKNYKRYLRIEGVEGCHKVYMQHFSSAQCDAANEARLNQEAAKAEAKA